MKDLQREAERERRKEKDHDMAKDKNKEKAKDHDRMKSSERDIEKTKNREKEKGKEEDRERDKRREKARKKYKEKESEISVEDKLRTRDREKETTRAKRSDKDESLQSDFELVKLHTPKEKSFQDDSDINEISGSNNQQSEMSNQTPSASALQEWLTKMKEDNLKKKSDDTSEILSWITKSRRTEEKKRAEMEALCLSKVFEEQDKILDESDEGAVEHTQKDLAGIKILHGLDKVFEGGAVVLTLKDQDILKGGDVNDDIDMLENVETGDQKHRDAAYMAAKRTGLYGDKYSDETGSRRTILPQYDDPIENEGVSFDEDGHFTAEAEKKLEELHKRIEGSSTKKSFEDLTSSVKHSSDYYTTNEMLQFKKPKKKKSLRKKEKLDIDALEAEAISTGLGTSDLGSRSDMKRQAAKEEQDKSEAEMRSNAYQAAYAKAEEASKVLRQVQTLMFKSTEDKDLNFGEDYEDLQQSLEQARTVALRKQNGAASGPLAVALAVAQFANSSKEQEQSQSQLLGDTQEDKIVITEIGEFVLGLQLKEGTQNSKSEEIFMDEEDASKSHEVEAKADISGWDDVQETNKSGVPVSENKGDIAADEIIHEAPLGKGLVRTLDILRELGALKETMDWRGRTMDKKKSKLVDLNDGKGTKDIRIERTDEFGRIMTSMEAYRMLSHKFHGKGPGKKKQEKRMKQYQKDLKIKQMKASDTPLLAGEKMREALARLQTPYLVLSGHVKPGQTSDPRGGLATVEKDHLGSLPPMLGDKQVEHFLRIKRKPDTGSMGPPPPKKPKNR